MANGRSNAAADWDTFNPLTRAAGPAPATKPVDNRPMPSWYRPEQPDAPVQPTAPDNRPMPAWYTPDPNGPRASAPNENAARDWDSFNPPTHPPAPSGPADEGSVGRNVAASLARVPGAILGTPHDVERAMGWLTSKAVNAASHLVPFAPNANTTADDFAGVPFLGPLLPPANQLPTADSINAPVFKATGIEDYQPRTLEGRVGSAAVTAGAAGALDPAGYASLARRGVEMAPALFSALRTVLKTGAKTAASGAAAQGTQEVLPHTPALAAAAALLTHGGLSALGSGSGVVGDAARQVFTPTAQGEREAGRALVNVDNTAPAIAQPTDTDLAASRNDVSAATNEFGAGLEPWQAGTQLRDALQGRVNDLKQARTTATAPIMAARDMSTASVDLAPVRSLIADKLATAAGSQRDAITGASQDLMLPPGVAPAWRSHADQLAASRQAISARISAATRSGDDASAAHLLAIRGALDTAVNAAVPEAGEFTRKFAELSRPLDPSEYGPVAKTLDRDQFNSRYTFPDERIPDLFLRSPATRTDLNQLIAAHGGDRDTALSALQEHLAGRVQDAINPDGTLDQADFDRAMAPYQKSLGGNIGMWFPDLARKFANARAAQDTLDMMKAQRGLADAVRGGALRDGTGAITGTSFSKWLSANSGVIAKTQSPAAATRLQSIGRALTVPQGVLADALKSEILPVVAGTATFGLEGGVLSTLLHRATSAAFGGLDQRRSAAFSSAIERATLDSQYAATIARKMGSYGRGLSPTRALVRAIYSTAVATNSANGRAQRSSQ